MQFKANLIRICLSVAYSKSLLNYTTSGKHVVTRHTKLPQFNLVKTKETEGIGTGNILFYVFLVFYCVVLSCCGVVWLCGCVVVWCDVVWCGACGVVWCGVVWWCGVV